MQDFKQVLDMAVMFMQISFPIGKFNISFWQVLLFLIIGYLLLRFMFKLMG